MSGRAVTLTDVATKVGVSARTVSRVVNNEGGYTPETRDRILAAIDELGYRPNLMARGLIRSGTDTIGLLTCEMLDPFFPEVAEGVNQASTKLGRTMLLAATHNDREEQTRVLSSFQGLGVDGAIVFPARDTFDDLRAAARAGLPIVIVNHLVTAPNISAVSADIQRGAELAVEHLADQGRSRIALLIESEAHHYPPTPRREAGYLSALERSGLPVDSDIIVPVFNSVEGGRDGLRRLLESTRDIDAIFAFNDIIAIGALQEMLSAGISVPDDVAIVGFDDISMCQAVTPTLSSVKIDREVLGMTAVEVLQDLIETGDAEARSLPVELVVRDSS